MRVAVMAAGAVGGYFGGRLAAAGHDVAFIARGAHRDAMRRDGLKIESGLGDLHLKSVDVTDDPKQVGPVDVVLFAGVLYHLSDPILGTRLTFNVLKPGGTCLLETGATRSEERILEYGGKNQTNKGGGANWFFPSPLVVTEIMDEVGYTDIRSAVNHRANKRRDRMVAVGTKTKQVDMLRAGLSVPTVR